MNALIATVPTLQLFAPLLVAVATALGLSVFARVVGDRKYNKALRHVGGPLEPLELDRTPGLLSVVRVPALDFQSQIDQLLSDPSPLEAAKSAFVSAADSAAMTLRMERIFLDDGDVVECR